MNECESRDDLVQLVRYIYIAGRNAKLSMNICGGRVPFGPLDRCRRRSLLLGVGYPLGSSPGIIYVVPVTSRSRYQRSCVYCVLCTHTTIHIYGIYSMTSHTTTTTTTTSNNPMVTVVIFALLPVSVVLLLLHYYDGNIPLPVVFLVWFVLDRAAAVTMERILASNNNDDDDINNNNNDRRHVARCTGTL